MAPGRFRHPGRVGELPPPVASLGYAFGALGVNSQVNFPLPLF